MKLKTYSPSGNSEEQRIAQLTINESGLISYWPIDDQAKTVIIGENVQSIEVEDSSEYMQFTKETGLNETELAKKVLYESINHERLQNLVVDNTGSVIEATTVMKNVWKLLKFIITEV